MSAKPPWIPSDHELDTLARSIDPAEPIGDRVELDRARLLAATESAPQQRRLTVTPLAATASIAMAAAAALIVWLVVRPSDSTPGEPKQTIAALSPSRFERTSDWPDYLVRIDDGRIAVQVAALAPGERFRVKTADAELELRETQVVIEVDNGRLASVFVERGWIELRKPDEPPVQVKTGETWQRVRTAARLPADSKLAVVTPDVPATAESVKPTAPTRVATVKLPRSVAEPAKVAIRIPLAPPSPSKPTQPATAPSAPSKPTQPPKAPTTLSKPAITTTDLPTSSTNPGEADFRAGWTALRAGNSVEAAKLFTSACSAARRDAFGEDACFWTAVAAKRAGQSATAKAALARFVERYPSSGRAAEASALLGWTLYESGDLDGAEALFRRAANDRVPKVRESAQRGLLAIERRRAHP